MHGPLLQEERKKKEGKFENEINFELPIPEHYIFSIS